MFKYNFKIKYIYKRENVVLDILLRRADYKIIYKQKALLMKNNNIIKHNKSKEIVITLCILISNNLKDWIIIAIKEDRIL